MPESLINLYRRLYGASPLDQVLFTIGLVLMAMPAANYLLGNQPQQINLPDIGHGQHFRAREFDLIPQLPVGQSVGREGSNSKSSASRSVHGPSRIFTSSGGMVEFVTASRRTRQEGKTT